MSYWTTTRGSSNCNEARVDDHLVFSRHRLSNSEEVLLLAPVVLVAALQLDCAGRCRGDERLFEAEARRAPPRSSRCRSATAAVAAIGVMGAGADPCGSICTCGFPDRSVADVCWACLRCRDTPRGKRLTVAAPGGAASAAPAGRCGSSKPVRRSVMYCEKPVFAILAVTRDVDPALGLSPHRPRRRARPTSPRSLSVNACPSALRREERRRSRAAGAGLPRSGGQDAALAALHGWPDPRIAQRDGRTRRPPLGRSADAAPSRISRRAPSPSP